MRPILTAEMTYDDKHDEFEDDEEFDDSDAFVRSTNGYVGDAEALLRRAIDIIASAPTMPLSSSPRIDRDVRRYYTFIHLVQCKQRPQLQRRFSAGFCRTDGRGRPRS